METRSPVVRRVKRALARWVCTKITYIFKQMIENEHRKRQSNLDSSVLGPLSKPVKILSAPQLSAQWLMADLCLVAHAFAIPRSACSPGSRQFCTIWVSFLMFSAGIFQTPHPRLDMQGLHVCFHTCAAKVHHSWQGVMLEQVDSA